ncbi:MAG: energy transducer TonB [Chitinivibrionia bacterium]|nr:energy transducer TonB [Chitinivibrionia bacterium]
MKTFSLANAARLPVTGELHPLRREFVKWLSWGNASALLVAALIFVGWYMWSHREVAEDVMPAGVQIVKYTELGVPPSITRQTAQATQLNVAAAAASPSIGIPEPVPDEQARQSTIATQAEMADALAPITASELTGGSDSIIVDMDGATSPKPGEFVAFDELPVLLNAEQPVYPDLAREAGFSGTVTVNVLVGKDGKVKRAIAVDGPELLRQPAIDAALKARFKPALQGRNPVEVWVLIPFIFELNR